MSDKSEYMPHQGEDAIIRAILEGTAAETGDRFFSALVRTLAQSLAITGAWITEYLEAESRLRSVAFWWDGDYVKEYEYDIANTPCEAVIEKRSFIHFPENIISLFPKDPDLEPFGAVSYMGVPLQDTDGTILGHLAGLHRKPLPQAPRVEALFRIFAARAAAEIQRLRAEEHVRRGEEKLSSLIDSAMDAIVELDSGLIVTNANQAALEVFGATAEQIVDRPLATLLSKGSATKLRRLAAEVESQAKGRQYLWIPGGLKAISLQQGTFPAEASLSRCQAGGETFFILILRNIHDQLEAERRIDSLTGEANYLREEIEQSYDAAGMVGESRPMRAVIEAIQQVAPTEATVLIHGESGTGKELIAHAIHAAGRRSDKPLIKVNCAAIAPTLIESEFFSHEKGAFTGATRKRQGRFSLATHGTIFLDEIGELPIDLQPKLLRVLQEGEFEPVGSSVTQKVDVRVIAATNRDLPQRIQEGSFREDLFYRLNVFPVAVPALRERGYDIEILANEFVRKFSQRMQRKILPLTADQVKRLRAYDWPGNVRELQNVIERAVIISRSSRLSLERALPLEAARPTRRPVDDSAVLTVTELRDLERQNLVRALEQCGWRISGPDGAAHLLGTKPSTLTSRMKALDVRRRA